MNLTINELYYWTSVIWCQEFNSVGKTGLIFVYTNIVFCCCIFDVFWQRAFCGKPLSGSSACNVQFQQLKAGCNGESATSRGEPEITTVEGLSNRDTPKVLFFSSWDWTSPALSSLYKEYSFTFPPWAPQLHLSSSHIVISRAAGWLLWETFQERKVRISRVK